tara:strand:+ start:1620 stop:2006 length:387 start_codon:yes stop_codon:yes gene_type:complete
MRADKFGERAHPICHYKNIKSVNIAKLNSAMQLTTQKNAFAPVKTNRRPYISDSGASIRGPTTYPKTNIETVSELSMSDVLSKSLFIKDTPGANIEDARGEMNVMLPRREMSNHFRFSEKLRGISGSS